MNPREIRIESVTKRIHEGHIAGKGQNSKVHYNLVARQLKPREGPKVTLRGKRIHKSSNALRVPRETVVMLQKSDSNPIRSESRSWPDEECEQSFFKLVREFVPMCRSQDSFSPNFLYKGESTCMLLRLAESVTVGQNPSSNPKARGVRVTLNCGTREKGVQTPDFILLSLPRETVVLVQKSLEVTQERQTREA